ncbi:MAG: hypothetical protein DI523_24810 [Paraburkholderia fungorum]|nr:MAG: hypothetical protein DI523_24810 [Paraburkholderia fungorum]
MLAFADKGPSLAMLNGPEQPPKDEQIADTNHLLREVPLRGSYLAKRAAPSGATRKGVLHYVRV